MSMPSGSDMCAMGQLRRFGHRSYLPKPLGWSTPWYHAQHFSPSWLKFINLKNRETAWMKLESPAPSLLHLFLSEHWKQKNERVFAAQMTDSCTPAQLVSPFGAIALLMASLPRRTLTTDENIWSPNWEGRDLCVVHQVSWSQWKFHLTPAIPKLLKRSTVLARSSQEVILMT